MRFIDGVYVVDYLLYIPSVEYLHSMSCCCLLPRNDGSLMRCPLESIVYPIALMRSGL